MYVKEHLQCKQIDINLESNIECLAVNLTLSPQMSFILVGVYRQPSDDVSFYMSCRAVLKQVNDYGKEVILLGDFNVNWMDKKDRKKLKEITGLYGFSQMINGPTRLTQKSKTQIDLVFSNKPERTRKALGECRPPPRQ